MPTSIPLDPFESQRVQLIHDLAFGDWTGNYEGWENARARLAEISPRDGSNYEIKFPGPARETPPIEVTCLDCGRIISSSGGISWISEEEEASFEHPVIMNIHWSEDCPAWKHRRWRIWHRHVRGVWIWFRHPVAKYRWMRQEREWAKEDSDDDIS